MRPLKALHSRIFRLLYRRMRRILASPGDGTSTLYGQPQGDLGRGRIDYR